MPEFRFGGSCICRRAKEAIERCWRRAKYHRQGMSSDSSLLFPAPPSSFAPHTPHPNPPLARCLSHLHRVVLQKERDREDAVDVFRVARLHLGAEAHGLVLSELLGGDGGDEGADARREGVLLTPEAVVGGELAGGHDGLLHLELQGGVEGHALALVEGESLGVGRDNEQLLGVHVDDGSDLEVLPVPAGAEGIVAVDGELAALHHLLEGVATGVGTDHSEHLHGVVGEVVLEGEPLEVAVEALPVVPDAVKAEDFAVILEEAPASLRRAKDQLENVRC